MKGALAVMIELWRGIDRGALPLEMCCSSTTMGRERAHAQKPELTSFRILRSGWPSDMKSALAGLIPLRLTYLLLPYRMHSFHHTFRPLLARAERHSDAAYGTRRYAIHKARRAVSTSRPGASRGAGAGRVLCSIREVMSATESRGFTGATSFPRAWTSTGNFASRRVQDRRGTPQSAR